MCVFTHVRVCLYMCASVYGLLSLRKLSQEIGESVMTKTIQKKRTSFSCYCPSYLVRSSYVV